MDENNGDGRMGWWEEEAKQIHNFCFSFALSVDFELLTKSHVLNRNCGLLLLLTYRRFVVFPGI